jgi:phage-related protein
VLDNLPQLLELAAQLILALVQGITENLPKIAEGAGELIPKIIATVVDKLPEIIDTGFEITVELVKGILKALPKIVESVVQLIGSMCIKFTEYDWLSLGKNLILGIKDGVVQYAYELINAVTDAGEKAYNAVKDFFGIASPSKLMRDGIGAYLPAGIAAGIMANEGDVTSAMNALADDVAGTTFGLPDIQGGNYSGANGGYGAYAAQPAIIQFVLPNGQVIAQWLEPDISAIQDRKIMIGQRGYVT